MDTRNRSLHIHYNKLSQISTGHCSFISTFGKNFHTIVRRKKYNHVTFYFISDQVEAFQVQWYLDFFIVESQDKLWKEN
jgi:hypothetical protein